MTHTPECNFVRIAEGLDVKPLLKLLEDKPELWKEIKARQQFTGTPHKDTESIYVRGPYAMSIYYVLWDTIRPVLMQVLKPALVPV